MFGRGNLFYGVNRYDEAEAAYDKALALNSDLAGALAGLGNVYYDLLRDDEANITFEKAIAIEPDLAEAWVGRGNLFANSNCTMMPSAHMTEHWRSTPISNT